MNKRSLSLILPIHNSVRHLEKNVDYLVELMPQLVDRFQIIIVDDGSTDGTGDVAQQLAVRYPQVEVVYHDRFCGEAGALESGRKRVKYQRTFVQAAGLIDEGNLRAFLSETSLWKAFDSTPKGGEQEVPEPFKATAAFSDERTVAGDRLVERLMHWGMALRDYGNQCQAEKAANSVVCQADAASPGNVVRSPKYSSIPEKRLTECQARDRAYSRQEF